MSVKIRFRKLSNGTQTILLDIYREGMKRQVESLPLRLTGDKKVDKETLLTAEAIRMQKELELVQIANGLKSDKVKNFNFIEFFKDVKNQKKKATAKVWQNTLNYLIEFAGEKLSFNSIDRDFAERFKKFMLGRVGSPNTANIYFSKFKASLNHAVTDGLIPANPIAHVKNVSKIDTNRAFLTIEEVRALSNAYCGNDEVKRAFLFACYTGLRLCDIRALTGENIISNKLQFRQLKTKGVQYVDLSTQALALLGMQPKSVTPVFKLPCHARVTILVDNWAKKAGIKKKVTFHVSRHTFATMALTYGADIYTVSKLLGHTDLKHTQVYAKIVDEKKMSAVEAIPGI